jgi:hypothetical protein
MVKYACNSPIYNWGMHCGDHGVEPPLHKGEYPADRIVHKHPAPRGERKSYDDSTTAKFSPSGSSHPHGRSVTEAVGHEVRRDYGKINPGAGRGNQQDRFSQGYGFGSSENAPRSRNPSFESQGRSKRMGVTG